MRHARTRSSWVPSNWGAAFYRLEPEDDEQPSPARKAHKKQSVLFRGEGGSEVLPVVNALGFPRLLRPRTTTATLLLWVPATRTPRIQGHGPKEEGP